MAYKKYCILGILLSFSIICCSCGNKNISDEESNKEQVSTVAVQESESDLYESDKHAETNEETIVTTEETEDIEQVKEPEAENTSQEAVQKNTQENPYGVCTSFSKEEVEAFANEIKEQVLNSDWKGLAENIVFPIRVGEQNFQDQESFVKGMSELSLSDAFLDAIEQEDCESMFCNYQGIILGSEGQIWLCESVEENRLVVGSINL